VGRVLAALVGIYCSAVVAAKFYRPFSEIVLSKLFPDMSSFTGDLVAFLFLMLVIGVSVSVGLGRNWAVVRLPQKLGVFNNIGGAAFGIIVGVLAVVLGAMVISLGLQVLNATAELGSSPTLLSLRAEMRQALLVPMLMKLVPVFVLPLRPWFPSGLPSILAPVDF